MPVHASHLSYKEFIASSLKQCRGLPWSRGKALDSELRVDVSILSWGKFHKKFHLISPGCPRPNSAFIVQKKRPQTPAFDFHFIFISLKQCILSFLRTIVQVQSNFPSIVSKQVLNYLVLIVTH